ncbi:MAG: nitrite reductase small subunit NirD [Pseudomonadales bacterium]|jgi:nitrite reductase (NADH) small subunit|nr:nitrite reductase small subunit NirD [Arenicellales bacterium]MDP6264904.1 nitrite reductase small subunit NirD [Pseudomonadales bacterium]|tara:strand:+ start:1951 stop:2286 length:336 start_codon:yes stop_codon:yes gene_type:complete
MSSDVNQEATVKWHSICAVQEIPQLGARTVRTGVMEVALFRLSDDRIMAVDNQCPHQQGPLAEGIVSGATVICPLHARKINLQSGAVLPPDSGRVNTYPVKVENGQVLLRL